MKRILFSSILSILFLFSYSSENPKTVIPKLVKKTLSLKLKSNYFVDNQILFLNVDTIINKKTIWDFDYREFSTKKDFINEFSALRDFLSDKKIIKFFTLDNNSLYDSPKHWVLRISDDKTIYDVDWWFSEKDINKLKGITISFMEKGN
jgi:hypothetical protein